MQKVLINTIIANHRCNLNCAYCETRNNPFLVELDRIEDKKSTIHRTLEKYNQLFDAEILTLIGGGEVFLEKNVHEWIAPFTEYYDHIEIITNGMCVPFKELETLNANKSFHLTISLDGHLFEMNKARFVTEKQFETVLGTMLEAIKRGIYVNISAVITKDNAPKIIDFLDYMKAYEDKLAVCFLPVMDQLHKSEIKMDYSDIFIKCLTSIIENHEKYSRFIAPKEYFVLSRQIISEKQNTLRCFSPFIRTAHFLDGRQVACCVNYIKELENVHTLQTTEEFFNQPIYKLLNRKKPVVKACKQCFPDFDLFNLYLCGRITLEDLGFNKPYSRPKIKKRLLELKNTYLEILNS
jgi:MoaA/NifB/PqqE/SkfB family radical SAM enzyme